MTQDSVAVALAYTRYSRTKVGVIIQLNMRRDFGRQFGGTCRIRAGIGLTGRHTRITFGKRRAVADTGNR